MNENSNIVRLRQQGEIDARSGARHLLAQAVEMEADAFLAAMEDLKVSDGRDRLSSMATVIREIQTGIGPVEVSLVKIRDRGATMEVAQIRFTSVILPLWARRTKSLDALLPVLSLRGISTGDFREALAALLGKDAPNLLAMMKAPKLPARSVALTRVFCQFPTIIWSLMQLIFSVAGSPSLGVFGFWLCP